jgi:hypothetical protein
VQRATDRCDCCSQELFEQKPEAEIIADLQREEAEYLKRHASSFRVRARSVSALSVPWWSWTCVSVSRACVV